MRQRLCGLPDRHVHLAKRVHLLRARRLRTAEGRKRPSPWEIVRRARLKKSVVDRYGGNQRTVKIWDGTGHWYKNGQSLIPIRWVFVRDDSGHRREEYFYTIHPGFAAGAVIGWFTCRWSIETTFQEMRAHLGFETTRGWARKKVLRAGPCLLGLFSVVSLIYQEHLKCRKPELCHRPGYQKAEATFSDAIAAVRRLFWAATLFAQPLAREAVEKLPRKLGQLLLEPTVRGLVARKTGKSRG